MVGALPASIEESQHWGVTHCLFIPRKCILLVNIPIPIIILLSQLPQRETHVREACKELSQVVDHSKKSLDVCLAFGVSNLQIADTSVGSLLVPFDVILCPTQATSDNR